MGKSKKSFKYRLIGLGSIILLIAIGLTIWWNIYSERQKSGLYTKDHDSETTIEFDQNDSKAWMSRSVSYNKAGDFNKGFEYLNKAVELDPKMHLGYRGWIRLRKMRDYDKALADFDILDSLTPNYVDAPWGENIDFLRGECFFGKKDYVKAIVLFNRNIKNQKEDWADIHSFVYLGLCEYELGNYESAISEFQRALQQSNNVPEAYFGIAKTYQKLGEIEKAQENIMLAEENIRSKREDYYNEFLNEIYLSEVLEFKEHLNK